MACVESSAVGFDSDHGVVLKKREIASQERPGTRPFDPAAFGLLDTTSGQLAVHRVAYDVEAAQAKIIAAGLPDVMIVGEVIESDPPRKLVQTWHPLFNAETAAEAPTRLTYEIQENQGGVCTVTITHDVTGAPLVAGMVPGGGDPVRGGGGWPWVLSDLKSLLETGSRM